MKILKEGEYGLTKWKQTLTCTGAGNGSHVLTACGALLEVEYEDLRYYPGTTDDTWGSSPSSVSFKCPICGAVTDLSKDIWPISYRKLPEFTIEWRDEIHSDFIADKESGK